MKALLCGCVAALLLLNHASAQEPASTKPTAPATAPPTDESLRPILREAIKLVTPDSKPDGRLRMPDFRTYALQADEDDRAGALTVLAQALTKVGDPAGAKDALESVTDLLDEIRGPAEKADVLLKIARVQLALGSKADALATAKQGLRQARAIKIDPDMPRFPGRDDDQDSLRAAWIRAFASIQAEAGELETAVATFSQAVDASRAVKDEIEKVKSLAEIAEARTKAKDSAGAKATWEAAMQAAKLKDPLQTARATEAILRSHVRINELDEAFTIAAESPPGDARAHALYALADAIIDTKAKVFREFADKLRDAAASAEYDRPSKKVKTFTRVAEVQVLVKDFDGALQTVRSLVDPLLPHYQSDGAQITILRQIARARTEAKDFGLARERLAEAFEIGVSFRDEDGLNYINWDEFAVEQARAGDGDRAVSTADSIGRISQRVFALADLAGVRAEEGDLKGARTTITLARQYLDGIGSEMLWTDREEAFQYDITPRALRRIAVAKAKVGDFSGAIKTIESMPKTSSYMADSERAEACEAIAPLYLKAGDVAGALKLMAMLDNATSSAAMKKSEIYESLATKHAERGEAAAALTWAKALTESKPKVMALKGIGQGILDAKAKAEPKKE